MVRGARRSACMRWMLVGGHAKMHRLGHPGTRSQPPCAGYSLVHLVPRTGSLVQAGGVERMVLRGHTGPLRKVGMSMGWGQLILS